MSLLLVTALASLQGLSEFLPVSSSGHLRLLGAAFGLAEPQTFTDVMLHLGTLVAVLAVYGRDVLRLATGTLRVVAGRSRGREDTDALRLLLWLVLASIPAALLGVLGGDWMEAHLASPWLVGIFLGANGLVLFVAGRNTSPEEGGRPLSGIGWRLALLIGLAQAFALLRGVSRSGVTISAALLLGVRREDAARFSFLLSLPAVGGAAVLEMRGALAGAAPMPATEVLVTGVVVAALVGWLALRLLLRFVRSGRLRPFAWYCWVLGLVAVGGSVGGLW